MYARWRLPASFRLAIAAAAATAVVAPAAQAEPSSSSCGGVVTRADVGRCALRGNLTVRSEAAVGDALRGRERAAEPLLPTNPVVSVNAGRRNIDVASATNWYVTLAQELEIAGQRGARRQAAALETEAQTARVAAAGRDATSAAWIAYFDALASADEVRLTSKLAATAGRIATVTREMADRGLLAPIDADVADAGRIAVEQARLGAERRARGSQLTLATALGLDPTKPLAVDGRLEPLARVEDDARAALGTDGRERPEVKAFDAERRAQEATATTFSRSRFPNPTVSVFVQNDGFNERVFGAGVSFPIPLPQPLGRFYDGQIAEANAQAHRAAIDTERARRQGKLELLSAMADYDMRKQARATFTDERVTRADQGIEAIAKQLEAGKLAVRDALISQQALVGVLRSELEARLALCVASVELARAAGLPLDRGDR